MIFSLNLVEFVVYFIYCWIFIIIIIENLKIYTNKKIIIDTLHEYLKQPEFYYKH